MLLVFFVALSCVVVYAGWLRSRMFSHGLVWGETRGLLRLELRRCAELRAHADGCGGFSFPLPVETRTRVLMVFGLPVWMRCESIGLPCGAEARFDQLAADDYDDHFTAAFRARSVGVTAPSGFHVPV